MAPDLAASLNLEPEFVSVDRSKLPQMLSDGVIDLMPGM
jgi:hypothetical protein